MAGRLQTGLEDRFHLSEIRTNLTPTAYPECLRACDRPDAENVDVRPVETLDGSAVPPASILRGLHIQPSVDCLADQLARTVIGAARTPRRGRFEFFQSKFLLKSEQRDK